MPHCHNASLHASHQRPLIFIIPTQLSPGHHYNKAAEHTVSVMIKIATTRLSAAAAAAAATTTTCHFCLGLGRITKTDILEITGATLFALQYNTIQYNKNLYSTVVPQIQRRLAGSYERGTVTEMSFYRLDAFQSPN